MCVSFYVPVYRQFITILSASKKKNKKNEEEEEEVNVLSQKIWLRQINVDFWNVAANGECRKE